MSKPSLHHNLRLKQILRAVERGHLNHSGLKWLLASQFGEFTAELARWRAEDIDASFKGPWWMDVKEVDRPKALMHCIWMKETEAVMQLLEDGVAIECPVSSSNFTTVCALEMAVRCGAVELIDALAPRCFHLSLHLEELLVAPDAATAKRLLAHDPKLPAALLGYCNDNDTVPLLLPLVANAPVEEQAKVVRHMFFPRRNPMLREVLRARLCLPDALVRGIKYGRLFADDVNECLAGNALDGLNRRDTFHCQTALYVASKSGNEALVARLLELGANPNVTTATGLAPLFPAARRGFTDIVRRLIDAGADVNLQDHMRRCAFDIALRYDRGPVLMLLACAGAVPGGVSPAHWIRCRRTQQLKALCVAHDMQTLPQFIAATFLGGWSEEAHALVFPAQLDTTVEVALTMNAEEREEMFEAGGMDAYTPTALWSTQPDEVMERILDHLLCRNLPRKRRRRGRTQ